MNIIIHSLMFSISPPLSWFSQLVVLCNFLFWSQDSPLLQSNQFEFQLYFIYSPSPITLHASLLQHQKADKFPLYSVLPSPQLFSSPASVQTLAIFHVHWILCFQLNIYRTSFNFLYIFDDLSFIKQMKH